MRVGIKAAEARLVTHVQQQRRSLAPSRTTTTGGGGGGGGGGGEVWRKPACERLRGEPGAPHANHLVGQSRPILQSKHRLVWA